MPGVVTVGLSGAQAQRQLPEPPDCWLSLFLSASGGSGEAETLASVALGAVVADT